MDELIEDPDTNTIFISTRHDTHAGFAERALLAGKRVFVEKPLAISREELASLTLVYDSQKTPFVMVGFNRRFSPLVAKMRELLVSSAGAKSVVVIVNSGSLPRNHWTQDRAVGGGRIIGEACHFVDLIRYLVGQPIERVVASSAKDKQGVPTEDVATITLSFVDGSMGTLHYLASGHKSVSKERVEVFVDGKILQLDNFRTLTGYGWDGFRSMKMNRQDKGHRSEIAEVVRALTTGASAPIPWNEIVEVTTAVFDASDQIRQSSL